MPFHRLIVLLGSLAALAGSVRAAEDNFWPVHVAQRDAAGGTVAWQTAGPLIFSHPGAEGGTVSGFRPLWVQYRNSAGLVTETDVLYPVFTYRADAGYARWSLLSLVNGGGPRDSGPHYAGDQTKAFDVFPFYFSRDTGAPATSYHAVWPLAGTVKNRFQHDELTWVLWPLYLRGERNGMVNTSTPWPFIQRTSGTDTGFALWPLFGWHDSPGRFERRFFLWPLGWNNTIHPDEDAPAGTAPARQVAFLPFFSHESRPHYTNEYFLWPFFGFTDRTAPTRYHETRYLWPLFVQGRGDQDEVNRWGPFYTHSVHKGMAKTWYLWPLLRQTEWEEGNIAQKKTQFLYLLYWDQEQRSLTNPAAAPGHRTHVWPLFSRWDNGAGHEQFQLLSPFDVFWPYGDRVREAWTPLFALYRSDRQSPEQFRWSLLWNAVTWRHQAAEKEFHLGPLLGVHEQAERKRVALLGGLLGWQRGAAGTGWNVFWFDFSPKPGKVAEVSR